MGGIAGQFMERARSNVRASSASEWSLPPVAARLRLAMAARKWAAVMARTAD